MALMAGHTGTGLDPGELTKKPLQKYTVFGIPLAWANNIK